MVESSRGVDFFLISRWARLNLIAFFLLAKLVSNLIYSLPRMTEGLLLNYVLRCRLVYFDLFYLKDLFSCSSLFIRFILLRYFYAFMMS